jgi:antibiotic biosynthesis monooxygenase (ABM) superfamily enzyme
MTERITSIVRLRVQLGQEKEFRALIQRISAICATFPGHQGTRIIEPANPEAERVTIFSFDSYENFLAWESSPQRKSCLEKLNELVEGEVLREQISGLDYWIAPGEKASATWPPSWRMTTIAFLAILPLALSIPPFFRPLIPNMPILGSILAIAAVTIVMSYISLPLMVRIFRSWL